MTQTKISLPLYLAIAGTIGFNLSPILFGYDLWMNICFAIYAGIMLFLSFLDRRVLGYATIISACHPANSQSYLSFSLLLAFLTIVKESPDIGRVVWKFGKQRWWWLLFSAFILIGLSIPFWPSGIQSMATETKQAFSRLGYLTAFSLAVGLSVRTVHDGVRAVSLLCIMSTMLFVVFYFYGISSQEVISAIVGGETIGVAQQIGNISLYFVRTQVCIPLATLAAVTLALGVAVGFNARAFYYWLASGACVFMIMLLASTGSAIAMVCGMVVVVLGHFVNRRSVGQIVLGVFLFSFVALALYLAVFRTENMLAARLELKMLETSTTGIDRKIYWMQGIGEIPKTPFGRGWSTAMGHSDWLLFPLAYGWLTGLIYLAAWGALFSSMWGALSRNRYARYPESIMLILGGLAAQTVYFVNAVFDMPSANIGYYQIVWALILTPAIVVTVANTPKLTTKYNGSALLTTQNSTFYKRPRRYWLTKVNKGMIEKEK